MKISKFKDNLGIGELPKELELLINFQNDSSFENYSDGFGISIDNKSGLKSWSNDPEFIKRVLPFAQANGCGSFYAFWDMNNGNKLSAMPILVFGDEGGVHIVADNILQLMQLLTYDVEISVDFDDAYFYKDEDDYEESEDHQKYKLWLKNNFQLDPIEDPEIIIKASQDKYKALFDDWFALYYKE